MKRASPGLRALGVALIACLLVGCLPTAIKTSHPYILVRQEGSLWRALADEDPAYEAFSGDILADPYLERVRGLFDGATKALIASDISTGRPQTAANVMIILLNSQETGLQRHIAISKGSARVRVELALALGREGREDAFWVRHHFAWAVGLLLYELMGQEPAAMWPPARPYEVTSPARALEEGWAGALDLLHAEAAPEAMVALQGQADLPPTLQDRVLRDHWARENGFLMRFQNGQLTAEARTPQEAVATSGVVTTFFYRLLKGTNSFYPQQYMLWFANIEPEDVPYGKVLLAFCRMPKRDPSLEAFVKTYGETFPAERAWVEGIYREVIGASIP